MGEKGKVYVINCSATNVCPSNNHGTIDNRGSKSVKVQPPCNFGEILTKVAQTTSRMLNISSQTDSHSMCDVRTVDAFKDNVSPTHSNRTEEVPRLLHRISKGEKYIATINRINVMLKDLIAEPANFCSTKKTVCRKILRVISDESKWAIRNPISSQ